MAGVTNRCRHCDQELWDEETSYERCVNCGQSDWDQHLYDRRIEEAMKTMSDLKILTKSTNTTYELTDDEWQLVLKHRALKCQGGAHNLSEAITPNDRAYEYCTRCNYARILPTGDERS